MTMILKHWKSIEVESERPDNMLTEVNGQMEISSGPHFAYKATPSLELKFYTKG